MSKLLYIALVLLFVVAVGCGSSLPADVSGVVTLDGQPLNTGSVTFYAAEGGATATGRIDADGRYSVKTGQQGGLQAGNYRVAVKAVRGAPSPTMTDAEVNQLFITPRRYGDPATSGLTYAAVSGSSTFDIDLTD